MELATKLKFCERPEKVVSQGLPNLIEWQKIEIQRKINHHSIYWDCVVTKGKSKSGSNWYDTRRSRSVGNRPFPWLVHLIAKHTHGQTPQIKTVLYSEQYMLFPCETLSKMLWKKNKPMHNTRIICWWVKYVTQVSYWLLGSVQFQN